MSALVITIPPSQVAGFKTTRWFDGMFKGTLTTRVCFVVVTLVQNRRVLIELLCSVLGEQSISSCTISFVIDTVFLEKNSAIEQRLVEQFVSVGDGGVAHFLIA
jgi:hypothetical protein